MRNALLVIAALFIASPSVAHEKSCKEFKTYEEAVSHCKAGAPHVWPTDCGAHDRDKDNLPCECLPGGPESNDNACKSWRKKNLK